VWNRGGDAAAGASGAAYLTVARAGVTIASVQALDYLRQSVIHCLATIDVVQYVRNYVAADDPARPFAPPGVHYRPGVNLFVCLRQAAATPPRLAHHRGRSVSS
jgi:hypothetical protein